MAAAMINKRGMALLLTVVYALFAVQTIWETTDTMGGQLSVSMPIVMTMTYIFCVYFFWEIQRGKPNIFEKVMAWSSAGVFVVRLIHLACIELRLVPLRPFTFSYAVVALISVATIALFMRTLQLFREHKRSQTSPQT